MYSLLLQQAIDPHQYDLPDTGWEKIARPGIEGGHRKHFLYYVETVVSDWEGRVVLDVGAGSGWLVKYAVEKGAKEAVGIDPAKLNVDIAAEAGIQIIQDTLESYKPERLHHFDTIIAIYVLSHILDLDSTFRKISELLTSDGEFVTIVPDMVYARTSRASFELEIEQIENDPYDSYVIRIKREHGSIADIVRPIRAYVEIAAKYGITLVDDIEMKVTDELLKEHERYKAIKETNTTLTHLLRFKKVSEN